MTTKQSHRSALSLLKSSWTFCFKTILLSNTTSAIGPLKTRQDRDLRWNGAKSYGTVVGLQCQVIHLPKTQRT